MDAAVTGSYGVTICGIVCCCGLVVGTSIFFLFFFLNFFHICFSFLVLGTHAIPSLFEKRNRTEVVRHINNYVSKKKVIGSYGYSMGMKWQGFALSGEGNRPRATTK